MRTIDDIIKSLRSENYNINLDTKQLPREREDLWYVKLMDELDGFISSAYFIIDGRNNGFYIRFNKASILTGKQIGKLKFEMTDFPDNPIGLLTRILDGEIQKTHIYGLTSYGEVMSDIDVELKDDFDIIASTDEDMIVKLIVKDWMLVYC